MIETQRKHQFCRIYNLMIIKKLWQAKRGVLCKTNLGEKDPDGFYKFLNMSKESFRNIINFKANYNITKITKHAKEVEERTGVPYVYLTGNEYINYSKAILNIDDIISYIQFKEIELSVNDEIKDIKKEQPDNLDKEYENILQRKINEKKKFEEAEKFIIWAKMYESKINKSINTLCSLSSIENLKETDIKLFYLMYYLEHNNKYEEIGVDRIMEYMRNMDVKKLSNLPEDLIAKYISALHEQIEIAREAKIIKKITNINK